MSNGNKGGSVALVVIVVTVALLALFGVIEFNADRISDLINWVAKK